MHDERLMTVEEMQRHEWFVSWSGGKDSTRTILLMHDYKIPVKKIIYVRMMFDDTIPATLPMMTDFVDRAAELFRSWGYPVEIIPSIKTATDEINRVYKKSIYPERIGNRYGVTRFMRGMCTFSSVKTNTINKYIKAHHDEIAFQMIGYRADETERLHRLGGSNQSILYALGITEQQAKQICKERGLLSPLYDTKISRDGCFFCPNAAKQERYILRRDYPELVEKIDEMIEIAKIIKGDLERLTHRNNWVKDYFDEIRFGKQLSFEDMEKMKDE